MANLVRGKHPAGEALKRALRDSAQDWSIIKENELQGQHDSVVAAAFGALPKPRPWLDRAERVEAARYEAVGSGKGQGSPSGRTKKTSFAERSARGKREGNKGTGGKKKSVIGVVSIYLSVYVAPSVCPQ